MADHFMELLCPAGNMDKLKMAIRYGADAVYCAGKRFGLRAGNSNFSDEELKEAVQFVHEHGKKIHVTCNIIPHNEDFEGLEDYLKFLESIGVLLKQERQGMLYPNSNAAKDIRELLEFWIKKLGIVVMSKTEATNISKIENSFFSIKAISQEGELQIFATKVLLATGGKAAPQYGSSGDGYALAKKLGHTITPLRPSLAAISCVGKFESLKGTRVHAEVTLQNKRTGKAFNQIGELQFTDRGVSGICVFNLSKNIVLNLEGRDLIEAFSDYKLKIDFMPEFAQEELENLLKERLKLFGEDSISKLLTSVIPAKLAEFILEELAKENAIAYISAGDVESFVRKLALKIKSTEFSVKGVNGWKEAQVTSGGVQGKEVNKTTFESNIVRGLFFSGELLDYDGICGGYNLSNAFYSGICVGRNVAECIG